MLAPGAATSTHVPKFDVGERASVGVVLATATTWSHEAGQSGLLLPMLPAEATSTTFALQASLIASCSSLTPKSSPSSNTLGSQSSVPSKLMLITSAPLATAQRMPSTASESEPVPVSPTTLALIRLVV